LNKKTKKNTEAAKPPTQHVRDADGIGKAWGVEFYAQRKQRMTQLEAIRKAMAESDFPAKIKGKGWMRADVVAWAMGRVELDDKSRSFKMVEQAKVADAARPTLDVGRETKDMPPSDKPAEGELFENSGFEATLDLWQDKLNFPIKWQEAPLQNWQMKLLQKHRSQLFERDDGVQISAADSVNIEGGYRGVAGWIRNNYQGKLAKIPNHTDIVNWSRGQYLPHGCRENFPASEASNSRYKTDSVVAWVEKYIVSHESGQVLPITGLDDRQRKEKADADMAEMAADAERKRTSGLYVLTATAQRTGAAIGIALRTLTREAMERELVKRVGQKMEDGRWKMDGEMLAAFKEMLLAECVTVFTEWQRRAQTRMDELVEQCAPVDVER
jgi:hypothetical protein